MKEKSRTNLSTAIYVRVSTEEQAQEGFSIRGQTEKLKSYSLLKDWDIYDIYADEGISGKNIVDRPAINRLINDIENGKVNNVLVYKVDRLTRSTKNLLELVELFEEHNCTFNSLTESIDTDTPSGRMFLKIIGIFAEFERENIAERTRLGKERKVKEGYTIASWSISYGYTKEKGQKVQVIQPNEARIVKEIFSMFLDKNLSMNKIAKVLNERKIQTKKNAISWDASTIRQILINPTYMGKVRYSTADENNYFEAAGQHEKIIPDETFYLVQEKIKNNATASRTKKPREASYFCGVLTCGMCKGKFKTHNYVTKANDSEEEMYKSSYRCRNRVYHNDDLACKSPDITHEKVERAFSEYIRRINNLTEVEDINIEDTAKSAKQELLENIVDLEKQLNSLQDRKRQIMERYVNGEMEFDEYKKILKIVNEKYEVLDGELQYKRAELPTITTTSNVLPEDIILNLKENWDSLTNNERMMFLQRFIKKITITVEKERKNSSIVNIEGIEFNLESQLDKNKAVNKTSTRSALTR